MNEYKDELRKPFATNTIKVKPQSVTADKSKGLVTFYVDARIVAERLNETVGAENWTDEYTVIVPEPALGLPVECRLTVNGVTKADVGQVVPGDLDDKVWKSAYSDAFKRAAVKFGVGAYLYESPNIWAEIKVGGNGKAQGFSDAGRAQALAAYAAWIGDDKAAGQNDHPTYENGGDGAKAQTVQQPPTASADGTWTWPFGKHKGATLADTPDAYLDWYIEKGDNQDIKDRIAAFRASGGGFIPDDDIPFAPSIDGLG